MTHERLFFGVVSAGDDRRRLSPERSAELVALLQLHASIELIQSELRERKRGIQAQNTKLREKKSAAAEKSTELEGLRAADAASSPTSAAQTSSIDAAQLKAVMTAFAAPEAQQQIEDALFVTGGSGNSVNALTVPLDEFERVQLQLSDTQAKLETALAAKPAPVTTPSSPSDSRQVAELQAKVKELQKKLANASTSSSTPSVAPVSATTSTTGVSSEELQAAQSQIQTLQQHLASKESELSRVQAQLAVLQSNASADAKLEAAVAAERAQTQAANQELATVKALSEQQRAQLAAAQSDAVALRSDIESLKSQLAQAEQTLAQVRSDSSEALQRVAQAQAECQRVVSELEAERAAHEATRQELAAEQGRHQALQSAHSELQQQADGAVAIKNSLESTITQHLTSLQERDAEIAALRQQLANQQTDLEDLELRVKLERERRLEFQFKYEDAKGKIRVYCRVRPPSKAEVEKKEESIVKSGRAEWQLELRSERADVQGKVQQTWTEYNFDQVFLPSELAKTPGQANGTQAKVFEECKMFIDMAMQGVNTCIFASVVLVFSSFSPVISHALCLCTQVWPIRYW